MEGGGPGSALTTCDLVLSSLFSLLLLVQQPIDVVNQIVQLIDNSMRKQPRGRYPL
jgi:hypothetical protein